MNTTDKSAHNARKAQITPATLMRLAGLSALVAGLCLMVIGMFHPINELASVTSAAWVNAHICAFALGFFGLFGMAGLYARQVEESGWLGLAGFLLFSIWMTLVSGFSFVEAFILPPLVSESPTFVEGFLGLFSGSTNGIDFGVLPMTWTLSNPLYILAPLLFGIATFRAGLLSRWAAALLAVGALLTPVGALVPPAYQPWVMAPVGLALAWLGYALFAERREPSTESLLDQRIANMEPSKAA
ncbi:MAG: hypothetical protein R3A44_23215 [Caldilineaceae bacterium]